MKETLLQKCQREAREKYAQDTSPKAHNLLSAEDLDNLIANTLKQAAEEYEREKIESYAQGWNEGQQALKEMTKHSVDLPE